MSYLNRRGVGQFTVVVFVVLVGVIAGAIYYYTTLNEGNGGGDVSPNIEQNDSLSPSPDAGQAGQNNGNGESEFETYVSDEYNFSIQYPGDWRVEDTLGRDGGYLQFFNYPQDKYLGGEEFMPGDVKIEIFAHNKDETMTLEDFVQDTIAGGMYEAGDYTFSRTTLGNSSAFVSRLEGESPFRTYYVSVDDETVLTVSLFPDVENERAEQVLSSFELQ